MGRLLPYEMFDVARSAAEAKRFGKMENIYHRGQDLAWNGNQVLADLVERHGKPNIPAHQRAPLQRVLGAILWGELAAWKIAAKLADQLEPLEARMAATSQAHDEARHFYVMHDYMELATGGFPRRVQKYAERLLSAALNADSPAKMILGMQLQLESTALTIFHSLREARVCPVLSDLLVLFEKDEARHVGLGTQILPGMLLKMSIPERVQFSAYSFKVAGYSLASLKDSEDDLRVLGVDPRRVAVLGKSKQMMVFDELWAMAPGMKSDAAEKLGRGFDAVAEILWPAAGADRSLRGTARRALGAFRNGYEMTETTLEP